MQKCSKQPTPLIDHSDHTGYTYHDISVYSRSSSPSPTVARACRAVSVWYRSNQGTMCYRSCREYSPPPACSNLFHSDRSYTQEDAANLPALEDLYRHGGTDGCSEVVKHRNAAVVRCTLLSRRVQVAQFQVRRQLILVPSRVHEIYTLLTLPIPMLFDIDARGHYVAISKQVY